MLLSTYVAVCTGLVSSECGGGGWFRGLEMPMRITNQNPGYRKFGGVYALGRQSLAAATNTKIR